MIDSPQIQEIKARYRASFPEKAEIVKALLDQVENENNLGSARDELHKLAGSSGMYGYQDLANLCRAGMANIDDNQVNDLLSNLHKLIDLLEQQG